MHGFVNAGYWLACAFVCLVSTMALWWRDVISEGRAKSLPLHIFNLNYTLKTTRDITPNEIERSLTNYFSNPSNK